MHFVLDNVLRERSTLACLCLPVYIVRFMPTCPLHVLPLCSGEWEHGKKQGVGYLQHSNGDVYNGEFHQDHAQGLCTLRYSSGDSYFGELHHGRKSGHGLMEYKTGAFLAHFENVIVQYTCRFCVYRV